MKLTLNDTLATLPTGCGAGWRYAGFVKAGNTAWTNLESRIPKPVFSESTVGSSGRRRAGAGNTSDCPLAILPRTGAAGSAWAADARPADAPKGVAPTAAILPVALFLHRKKADPQALRTERLACGRPSSRERIF